MNGGHNTQTVKIIGIAGGSGSGKSTVSVSLCRKYPEACTLLHVDDYYKPAVQVPRSGRFINWDDPLALDFDRMHQDMMLLKSGHPTEILTKSELYNPDYHHTLKNKIRYIVQPKPVLILEGYQALLDTRIRQLMDTKIYLDLPIALSWKRRTTNKAPIDQEYFEKILEPMHLQHVVPTKEFADLVVDVSDRTPEEVLHIVESKISLDSGMI